MKEKNFKPPIFYQVSSLSYQQIILQNCKNIWNFLGTLENQKKISAFFYKNSRKKILVWIFILENDRKYFCYDALNTFLSILSNYPEKSFEKNFRTSEIEKSENCPKKPA